MVDTAQLRESLLKAEVDAQDPRSRQILESVSAESAMDGDVNRRFIPERALERILTEAIINEVLSGRQFEQHFYKRPELIQLILKGG